LATEPGVLHFFGFLVSVFPRNAAEGVKTEISEILRIVANESCVLGGGLATKSTIL
jgi:hypothetical protein